MQQFMSIVLSLEFFILCISGSFWFFGHELGITAISQRSLDIEAKAQSYNDTSQSYETTGFNVALIFGDWGRSITEFFNAIQAGDPVAMMQLFGFPGSFIQWIIAIDGLAIILTVIYLFSGRG